MARVREKEPTAKEEALRSLEHAIKRVSDPEPLDALGLRLLAENLRYTKDKVENIAEANTRPRSRRRRQPDEESPAAESQQGGISSGALMLEDVPS